MNMTMGDKIDGQPQLRWYTKIIPSVIPNFR